MAIIIIMQMQILSMPNDKMDFLLSFSNNARDMTVLTTF